MFHLGQPTAHGLAGALQRCMRCLRTLGARNRIANQIQDIKSGVERASELRSRYNPRETTRGVGPSSHVATIPAPLDPRVAALFVEEAELVGIDEPKETLIQWLTPENEPHLSMISVVGMGGSGKTTLVRKVYESRTLGQHFQCRAWITVSKFPIEDLLRDMIYELQNIPRQETESLRPDRLIGKLKDHLEDKRYLIVFDDIWTTVAWDSIKGALPDSGNGSRVVVTTRIETVANTCCTAFHGGHVYKHQLLSDEQSWDLFSSRVFKSPKDGCPPDLKELSDAILERCGGLPLAIVTIAGLLASKPNKTREEWQRVLDHLGFELETNPDLERVKQVLNLSYNDLPYDLRCSFLYLSKYPEDYEIKRRHVVELWVAEGFARGAPGISAVEVAERYFDELISRSMIQPSRVNYDGKVKTCRVHDVMLEVIVSKSREQNLVSLLAEHGTASLMSDQKIRRLSAHTESRLEHTYLSHVRSITMFGYGKASFVSPPLRLLRILDLDDHVQLEDRQLKWIGKLVHLRYVNIRSSPAFVLPKSWGNLHELETLSIGDAVHFTRITRLQRLRHLWGCPLHLPNRGVASLKALQSLGDVYCGQDKGLMIEELGELAQLRHLSLVWDPSADMLRLSSSLAKLNGCLRYLKIKMRGYLRDQFACLESISPPLRLQKLKLVGPLKNLHSWAPSLNDVAKITLEDTLLERDAMEVLQKLPHLSHLKLIDRSFAVPRLFFLREGFQSLRILHLVGFESMESLAFEQGAMPNLWKLAIDFYRRSFFYLPSIVGLKVKLYGIEDLPRLKELDLCGAPTHVEDIILWALRPHPNHPKVTYRSYPWDAATGHGNASSLLQAAEIPATSD